MILLGKLSFCLLFLMVADLEKPFRDLRQAKKVSFLMEIYLAMP